MLHPPVDLSYTTILHAVTYCGGAVTVLDEGHDTGWRCLPYHVVGQLSEGTTIVNYEDGVSYTIEAGQAYFTPAFRRHRYYRTGVVTGLARWAHFTLETTGLFEPLTRLAIPPVLSGSVAAEIGRVCTALTVPPPTDAPRLACWAATQGFTWQLVSLLALHGTTSEEPLLHDRLAPALAVLHDHPDEDHSVAALAELVSLSPSRFTAVFTSAMGTSPMQYLQQLRLARAHRLLLETDLPINQLAAQLGYGDPFHFSRLFKATTGFSPRRYRSTMRGQVS